MAALNADRYSIAPRPTPVRANCAQPPGEYNRHLIPDYCANAPPERPQRMHTAGVPFPDARPERPAPVAAAPEPQRLSVGQENPGQHKTTLVRPPQHSATMQLPNPSNAPTGEMNGYETAGEFAPDRLMLARPTRSGIQRPRPANRIGHDRANPQQPRNTVQAEVPDD